MDQTGIPSPEGGHRRRRQSGGLRVIRRGKHWHIAGIVRVGGRSVTVRRTTGLSTARPIEEAEAIRLRLEEEILHSLVYGKPQRVAFSHAALEWLRYKQPAPTEIQNAKDLGLHFGDTPITDISTAAIAEYVRVRRAGNRPSTVNRYLGTLRTILNFARRMGWLTVVPHIERQRESRTRVDKWLHPDEVILLVECAATHLQPLLIFLACTGARVSEALRLDIADLGLAQGRERATLRNTKNGETYTVPLHPWAAEVLRATLPPGADGPVFRRLDGRPFKDRGGKSGGQIRGAFITACRRAATILRQRGQAERAAVMEAATPHWLRHNFASQLMMAGESVRAVMEAGRWKTARLVLETYGHLAPTETRRAIERLPFGKGQGTKGKRREDG
jgi:integrase